MEKVIGEVKRGIDWKVEGKKLIDFVLGPIPDCPERELREEQWASIQAVTIERRVKKIGYFTFFNIPKLTAVELDTYI